MHVGVYCSQISIKAGGGYTFQTEVLKALAVLAGESGHRFTLLVNSSAGFEEFTQAGKIDLSVLPAFASSKPRQDKRWQGEIKKRLNIENSAAKNRTRILPNHAEKLSTFIKAQGIQLLWFVGPTFEEVPDVPYIATVWDLQHRLQPFFPEVSSGGEWDFREEFFAKYLRRSAVVITGSNTGKAEVERFYQIPPGRIKTLPHPTPEFALNAPETDEINVFEKFGIPNSYVFYPAQFWAHKNHVNLLLALDILKKRSNLVVPAVFVGSDQGNAAYIREMIEKLGLSEQVKILGFVSHEELIALYRNAFALCYMTFFGPDNLPPLEAFALGCPVIASEVSGAREQLGDAALFVNPSNPEEISNAILSLYENSELRTRLTERGTVIIRKWTNNDFVRGVFDILDEFETIRRCWA